MVCTVAVGLGALRNLTDGYRDFAVGICAGASLKHADGVTLIGNNTSAPEGSSGFVNIGNKLCFWRDSGEETPCPPPEPDCQDGQP